MGTHCHQTGSRIHGFKMVEVQYQKVPGIKLTAEPKKKTSRDYTDHSSSYPTEVSKAPEDAVNTRCDRKKNIPNLTPTVITLGKWRPNKLPAPQTFGTEEPHHRRCTWDDHPCPSIMTNAEGGTEPNGPTQRVCHHRFRRCFLTANRTQKWGKVGASSPRVSF